MKDEVMSLLSAQETLKNTAQKYTPETLECIHSG